MNRSLAIIWLAGLGAVSAQTLNLPPRPADAPAGSALVKNIAALSLGEREARLEAEFRRGNVPDFLRRFCAVEVGPTVTVFVAPDYLAVGSDEDYFLTPLTPATAQRLADASGCLRPTRALVDAIYRSAAVKLEPLPLPPGPAMTTVEVFAQHNAAVQTQRVARLPEQPLGALVAGHKKDVVISHRLTNAPGQVAIYGWHRTNGQAIQPLYLGHTDVWVDYSHGIRLVSATVRVDGRTNLLADVLRDPKLAPLVSDEGPLLQPRYRLAPSWQTNMLFHERTLTFPLLPDVRVQINEPLSTATSLPLQLVLYALPNGNTIEQTAGRRLRPGDDWHFDIQHIAAQTRWLRAAAPERRWVIAYLETAEKSWPAWRKKHSDHTSKIQGMLKALTGRFSNSPVRVTLTGHSGGGSFTFGYLNGVERIPDAIERIAFLDSTYAYDPTLGHADKLARWLKASDRHHLSVLAYNDAVALYEGKPFVSATGGTWYRSQWMQTNLAVNFSFQRAVTAEFQQFTALEGRVKFWLKENPERKIFHTVQVERNGFLEAMLSGTARAGRGYEYFGARAYGEFIEP